MRKKYIIISLSVVFAIFISYLAWSRLEYFQKEKAPIAANKTAEQLVNENQAAIEAANNLSSFGNVPDASASDHHKGELSSPVKIILYSDFECEFCAGLNKDLGRLLEEYAGQVALAFRHYPLRSHANAFGAALASECAAEQGKFWEMHDALYAANDSGTLGIVAYADLAKDLGLDSTSFQDCLENGKHAEKIASQAAAADRVGVTGVPGLFINGHPYAGALPYDDFTDSQGIKREGLKTIVERELAMVEKN